MVDENPNYEKAVFNIAAINYDLYNFDETVLYYEKVIKINPKNDRAYYGLAAAEYARKNFTKSQTYCNKALEINPDHQLAKDLLEWFK